MKQVEIMLKISPANIRYFYNTDLVDKEIGKFLIRPSFLDLDIDIAK